MFFWALFLSAQAPPSAACRFCRCTAVAGPHLPPSQRIEAEWLMMTKTQGGSRARMRGRPNATSTDSATLMFTSRAFVAQLREALNLDFRTTSFSRHLLGGGVLLPRTKAHPAVAELRSFFSTKRLVGTSFIQYHARKLFDLTAHIRTYPRAA